MFESYLWFRRGGGLAAGTKVWFYADSAPDGWTIDATVADALLALKGGSQAYNVDGGNLAGTWTQPGHTLTEAEIPTHDHGEAGAHTHTIACASSFEEGYLSGTWVMSEQSGTAGASAGAHTHTSVGSGSAHNHGTAYRPLARVGLICAKNEAGNFDSEDTTYFYQNTAPNKWTAESFTDALLAVKGGSVYTTGASYSGTWTQPDHTLTADEIPAHDHGEEGAHTHTASAWALNGGTGGSGYREVGRSSSSKTSSSDGDHTHAAVGSGNAHNHGNTWRPYAAVGLICTKD